MIQTLENSEGQNEPKYNLKIGDSTVGDGDTAGDYLIEMSYNS